MNTVTFKCPTKIVANAIAILAEQGDLIELVNDYLEKVNMLEENKIDDSSIPEYDDSDYPDHTVTLELA